MLQSVIPNPYCQGRSDGVSPTTPYRAHDLYPNDPDARESYDIGWGEGQAFLFDD